MREEANNHDVVSVPAAAADIAQKQNFNTINMPSTGSCLLPIDYELLENMLPGSGGQVELLSRFMKHQQNDLVTLSQELEQGNPAGVTRVAHRLKGASLMAAARELADCYADIERAGMQSDMDAIRRKIDNLQAAVNRFETLVSNCVAASYTYAEGNRDESR